MVDSSILLLPAILTDSITSPSCANIGGVHRIKLAIKIAKNVKKNFAISPELFEFLQVIEINSHPKFKPKKSIKPHRSNPLKLNTLSIFFHWRFFTQKIYFSSNIHGICFFYKHQTIILQTYLNKPAILKTAFEHLIR